jgi:signal transduction histidine kinase
MKRLLADTLFKRLFALMWVALVVSHVIAFLVVTHSSNMPAGGGGRLPTFPSLPPMRLSRAPAPSHAEAPPAQELPGSATGDSSAAAAAAPNWQGGRAPGGPFMPGGPPGMNGGFGSPPMPGQAQDPAGGPGRPPMNDGGPRVGGPGPAANNAAGAGPDIGLPAGMALLDYGIRFVIIGLAAWLGARWLSGPMRGLAGASRTLSQSLARNAAPPQVDERHGTVEVRDAAHVFNEMSRQLSEQVNARALLVAAISHDLRTPLTRIRMRLENNEHDPLTVRSIADIHEMDDLIESALEVFRGPGHEEAAQVTDVLALVQSIVDDLADLGQPVTLQGLPALASVHPVGLRRVISNLVNNALRYGKQADLRVGTLGDEVEIVIDDRGPGIPEAQLEAVMKPFFRLESSRNRLTGGSGLGLYIARDLISRQGGRLSLSNRREGGLSATIALPRS